MFLLSLGIAFILGLSIGVGSQGELSFVSDTLSSWIAALATLCIAVLTVILARETWALRKLQIKQVEGIRKSSIQPNVNISLKSSPQHINLIQVHITNDGNGLAKNIKFNFENDNHGAEAVYNFVNEKIEGLSMLVHGLSALPAGDYRSSTLYNALEISEKFENKFEYRARIVIEYEDMEGTKYQTNSMFAFREFEGRSGSGDPLYKIASSIESIEKHLAKTS